MEVLVQNSLSVSGCTEKGVKVVAKDVKSWSS